MRLPFYTLNHCASVIFLCTFTMISAVAEGQSRIEGRWMDLARSIDTLVERAIETQAFPGAQIVIGDRYGIRLQKSFGYHTYDSLERVADHHLYDLASVTKVTTAVPALMLLVQDGLIFLDDPIGKYLPEWRRGDKKGITFRQALAHFAQLKPYLVFWQLAQRRNGTYRKGTFANSPSEKYSIKITDSLYLNPKHHRKMFRAVRKSELLPDKKYVYSGLTFLSYPRLVKKLTGQTIDQFLQKRIFEPIGADRICYRPLEKFSIEEIVPTERDTFFRHQLVRGSVHDENAAMLNGISTNAGLFASGPELAKLCGFYLNAGSVGGSSLIDSLVFSEFTRCQYCDEGNRRGLGFDKPPIEYDPSTSYVAASATPSSFGHSGFTGTFIWIDPQSGFYLIFLSNRVYPYRSQRGLYQSGFRPKLHQLVYDHLSER